MFRKYDGMLYDQKLADPALMRTRLNIVRPTRQETCVTSLAKKIDDSGARAFTKRELAGAPDLFAERAALFFTPTRNLPSRWVGEGPLDVTIPVPIPSWLEYREVSAYKSPRFWVDQLQRATGKIRWQPLKRVRIKFVIYDSYVRGATTTLKAFD